MPASWQTGKMENPLQQKKQKTDADSSLIRKINEGNPHLMENLVARYAEKLYGFGLKICRNPTDAEDLVQDTFINMIRYLKYFRYETKFRNWLYRIAVTACIRMRRKSKFAPDTEISLDDSEYADLSNARFKDSSIEEPVDAIITKEEGEALKNAIHQLPPQYRLILVLRDVEGFSVEETARITGLSQSNVKVRLHRARNQVKEILLKKIL